VAIADRRRIARSDGIGADPIGWGLRGSRRRGDRRSRWIVGRGIGIGSRGGSRQGSPSGRPLRAAARRRLRGRPPGWRWIVGGEGIGSMSGAGPASDRARSPARSRPSGSGRWAAPGSRPWPGALWCPAWGPGSGASAGGAPFGAWSFRGRPSARPLPGAGPRPVLALGRARGGARPGGRASQSPACLRGRPCGSLVAPSGAGSGCCARLCSFSRRGRPALPPVVRVVRSSSAPPGFARRVLLPPFGRPSVVGPLRGPFFWSFVPRFPFGGFAILPTEWGARRRRGAPIFSRGRRVGDYARIGAFCGS